MTKLKKAAISEVALSKSSAVLACKWDVPLGFAHENVPSITFFPLSLRILFSVWYQWRAFSYSSVPKPEASCLDAGGSATRETRINLNPGIHSTSACTQKLLKTSWTFSFLLQLFCHMLSFRWFIEASVLDGWQWGCWWWPSHPLAPSGSPPMWPGRAGRFCPRRRTPPRSPLTKPWCLAGTRTWRTGTGPCPISAPGEARLGRERQNENQSVCHVTARCKARISITRNSQSICSRFC